MEEKTKRIRQLINGDFSQSPNTEELVQQFRNSHLNDARRGQSQSESTTDILNTNIPTIRPDDDISQSTQIIRHGTLVTPSRRPVSGSSMDIMPSLEEIQKSNDQEIDFDLFWQLMDLKLPNDTTSFHFKKIVLRYIEIIESHDDNASADKFLITIYNQLRKTSTITPKLSKIIDTFLEAPANLGMKLANYQHNKDQQKTTRFFRLWLVKRRKFSELAKSEKIWNLYLKKKYLCKLTLAYDIVTDGYEQHADAFNATKMVLKSWDVWRTKCFTLRALNDIADDTQKKKYLQRWQNKIIADNEKADRVHEVKLAQRALEQWKLKKQCNQLNPVSKYYNQWKSLTAHAQNLESEAKQLEIIFHAGFFFSKWKRKSLVSSSKLLMLNGSCDVFVRRKFMKNWRRSTVFRQVENETKNKRDEFMLRFALKQWKRKLLHQLQLQKFDKIKNNQLLMSSIDKWKSTLTLLNNSEELEMKILTRKFFGRWRLATLSSQYELSRKYESASKLLFHWSKEAKLAEVSRKFQRQKVTLKFWEQWVLKHSSHQNEMELSQKALESFSKLIYLNNWKRALKLNHENEEVADTHFKKKFLGAAVSKFNSIKRSEAIADQYYDLDSPQVTVRRLFKNWKIKYENEINDKLQNKLKCYEASRGLRTKSHLFRQWSSRYRFYIDQEVLYKQEFVEKRMKRTAFYKWVAKFEVIRKLQVHADEVNYLNLLSSGFVKFQMMYQKIQMLEEKSIEYEEDRNVELILKFLKKWTYKNLQVEKNSEILKFFNKRWERAHLRALLSLWKNKTIEKLQVINESDYGNESVDSISPLKIEPGISGSSIFERLDNSNSELDEDDDSPTKFKSKLHRSSLSKLTQTPRKSIIEPSKSFQSTGGIPGSERVKKKRLAALRNHYSQIKYAIPSPIDFRKATKISSAIKIEPKADHRDTVDDTLPRISIFNSARKNATSEEQQLYEPLDSPVIRRTFRSTSTALEGSTLTRP